MNERLDHEIQMIVDIQVFNSLKDENEKLKNAVHRLKNAVAVLSWNINPEYRKVAEDVGKLVNDLFK